MFGGRIPSIFFRYCASFEKALRHAPSLVAYRVRMTRHDHPPDRCPVRAAAETAYPVWDRPAALYRTPAARSSLLPQGEMAASSDRLHPGPILASNE